MNIITITPERAGSTRILVLLKDLDYSFYNEIDIPGMPDTREEDVLKQYIFSASQCPQGDLSDRRICADHFLFHGR
ncbi:MAG: hypothetical protein ACLRTZ_04270 [Agathobacter sp.]